jgi:hypothetical protein
VEVHLREGDVAEEAFVDSARDSAVEAVAHESFSTWLRRPMIQDGMARFEAGRWLVPLLRAWWEHCHCVGT